MKTFILILFILFASIIVILKLITSPGTPVTYPDISLDMKRYDTGRPTYRDDKETHYRQSTDAEINNLKLMAFARAFVEVQSYMNKAGNKASYKETTKIVQNHGLTVEGYTKIASRMNENSDFQNKVQEMINEIN